MISVVSVYNDEDLLEKYLLKSLKKQTVNYDLFMVDNRQQNFTSASEALNYGAGKVKGNYIAFLHQDVSFDSKFLEELEKTLDNIDNIGIAGLAGVSEDTPGVISNIRQGENSEFVGKNRIESPTKVQTLDECLLVIPESVFEVLKFDENTCDDWHLYGVDYSLSAIRLGYDSYVLPLCIYHRSPGYSMSEGYDVTLKKVLKKHSKNYSMIYTTLGNYNTSLPLSLQKNMKKIIIPIMKALGLWKYD